MTEQEFRYWHMGRNVLYKCYIVCNYFFIWQQALQKNPWTILHIGGHVFY